MQLSIIIPVKNGRATLAACLRKMQGLAIAHEIILVNDHSTDGAVGEVAGQVDTVIALAETTGPGAARNAGAARARGAILLFIDADVFVPAADIEKSYCEFIDDNYSCAVGRYGHNPALALLGRYNNYYMMYKYFDKATTRIFFSSYAMIRKEFFHPFSESLKNLEDAALGHLLTESGQTIHIFKSMTVIHQKQLDALGLTRQFYNRSRDALLLAWSLWRRGRALRDDSVKINLRLSLLLMPLMIFGSFFTGRAFLLLLPLVLVNLSYFRYIKRFEGFSGLMAAVMIYFYTVVCGELGMARGLVKVLSYECMAPFKVRKTPLI